MFEGRIGRIEFLGFLVLATIVTIAVALIGLVLIAAVDSDAGGIVGLLIILVGGIAGVLTSIMAYVRRLHDFDRTGWWTLIVLLPIVGGTALFFFCLFKPGDEDANSYAYDGISIPGGNVWAIALKELETYFASPMAYVVAAAFLAITGFFFVASVSDAFSEASLRGFSAGAIFFMIFLSPALTMRVLAEEQKLGTLELLLTSPVRESEIVLGKFLASFVMLVIMLALSLYFVFVLFIFGVPDTGPLYTGYLGMILYGATTLAVGLAASAVTSNQLVALVVGAGVLTGLTVVDFIAERVGGTSAEVLNGFQLGSSFQTFDVSNFAVAQGGHFADFSRGIVNIVDVAYYVGMTGVFLFAAIILLSSRRWR